MLTAESRQATKWCTWGTRLWVTYSERYMIDVNIIARSMRRG